MGPFVSKKGAKFVAGWEGFLPCPYWDVLGQVWTIGYGETLGVNANTPCVKESDARKKLRRRLTRDFLIHSPRRFFLKQCEKDAIAAFLYNVGPGGVARGTGIGDRLRSKEGRTRKGRRKIFREELPRWDVAGGQHVLGLALRRKAEVKVANRNIYDSSH